MNYIGLTKNQVEAELEKQGINKFIYEDNCAFVLEGSTKLVTNCIIDKDTAYITMGSFKLKI